VIEHDRDVVETLEERGWAAGEELVDAASLRSSSAAGRVHGLLVRSDWPLKRLHPSPSLASADVRIVRDDIRTAALIEELDACQRQKLPDGSHFTVHPVADGIGAWFEQIGWFLIDAARRRVVASPPGAERDAWEHRLVGFAVPMLLGELGATVLHGCSVTVDGGAYVLCGPSGRGKTTTSLALVQAGAGLLSDDVTVLQRGDAPPVHPGPRGSRVLGAGGCKTLNIGGAAAVEPSPLRGLVVLEPRGSGPLLHRRPPADGFIALVSNLSPVSVTGRAAMFHGVAELSRSLPVHAATLPDDLAALPRSAVALLAALSRSSS